MNDREFLAEVGSWGFAVAGVTMLGIFFARLATDIGPLQSFGHTLAAFVLVPFLWLSSGRYAAYWMLRSKHKMIVRGIFICFWVLFTAKLFFLGESEVSPYGIPLATTCGLFSGYAASCSFRRVETGNIKEFHEPNFPPWLLHIFLVSSLVIFFMV